MEQVFLNPEQPLVAAVAEWLAGQARTTPGGVKALDHLLVIVPTRQAGRRLRLALAERTGGCLPPRVQLPAHVIVPATEPDPPAATPAESLGLLARLLLDADLARWPNLFPASGHPREQHFTWALGVARQLNELWGTLQENALTMRDVANRIETLLTDENLDVEVARWQDLADVEALFFETLRQSGRTPAPLVRQQAVKRPALPEGVERIILPALADAQPALYPVLEALSATCTVTVLLHAPKEMADRFDAWGRPLPERWLGDHAPVLPLADRQILLAANSVEQARLVASTFEAVPATEAWPSLGMADDALFSELQSAFLARGIALHNPASYPLAASSLGRLITQLEQLCRTPRFPLLAAFLREADVMRWLESRLANGVPYAALLAALDELQNRHLPQTLPDALRFCDEACSGEQPSPVWLALRDALRDVKRLTDPEGDDHVSHLSRMLRALFAQRILHEQAPGDRELAAAAEATLGVLESLGSDALITHLDDAQRSQLFETLIATASYQLEPESADVLLTEGWLELQWSPARELVIAGFNEGSVPDAIVGHAFLPDSLREGLGLTTNARRTARDTYLLLSLLAARRPGDVRLTLERVSSHHDVRKPSRLLFLCGEEALSGRARRLFSDPESAAAGHPRSLPDAWRLTLPIPANPPERLRVTAFKGYLECPFTFYLRHLLKMESRDDRAAELDAAGFGNLCHDALEAFGRSELRDSSEADEITAFLQAEVQRAVSRRFCEPLPALLHLQREAACRRLSFFAQVQARLRAEGWRIHAIEQPLQMTEHGMTISGRADRIDRHDETGAWRIIDYKTWDRLGANDGADRFSSSGRNALAAAEANRLPSFVLDGKKKRVWTDLQLPLYQLMAEACGLVPASATVECGYLVLGETDTETLCRTWRLDACRDEAIAAMRWVIGRVKAGIFWPPAPGGAWTRDFGSLFLDSPEQSVSQDWIRDQEARLARQGGTP